MREHISTQHRIAILRVKPHFYSFVSVYVFSSLFTFSISAHSLYGVCAITCFSLVYLGLQPGRDRASPVLDLEMCHELTCSAWWQNKYHTEALPH